MAWFEKKLTKTAVPWFEKVHGAHAKRRITTPEMPDFESHMTRKLKELEEAVTQNLDESFIESENKNDMILAKEEIPPNTWRIQPDFHIACPLGANLEEKGPFQKMPQTEISKPAVIKQNDCNAETPHMEKYLMEYSVIARPKKENFLASYDLENATCNLQPDHNMVQDYKSAVPEINFQTEQIQNEETLGSQNLEMDDEENLPDFENLLEETDIPEDINMQQESLEPETQVFAENPVTEEFPEKKTRRTDVVQKESENSHERASITPPLKINRQQTIPFQILKTQKRAFEISNPAEAQSVIAKLEETLDQFGIEGRVIGLQRGPIVTRYELRMAPGIKVNRILSLTDELAMALEAIRVRIEAPIPGRSTVGIEIPNKDRAKVLLGDILHDDGFREHGGELTLPLGRDIAGNLLLEDLTRMPHLLIAGATGSGKSVAVNSFITSTILNRTPDEVRFMLIDPKLVELSSYNDIPHLLHPVITDSAKAILALNWLVEEMERRYEDLADMRVRDIRGYNAKIKTMKKADETVPMPYIIVLIDELGDLMMVAGKEVESSIIRLAQKARAVGIHLILATQRPSVDVITALIKANCPARIALQVAQKTDSRTILDSNGAEQLLGQGDMLFRHPSRAQLIRAQAPLVLDEEVEAVVNWARKMGKPEYITLEDPKGNMGQLEPEEEALFDEAWAIIVESQKASASYLQRRLRIGYNRAARLIEAFEARGMIGPQVGSKPREILG